ncbi:MAG: hypothetical protein ACTJFM_03845 [Pseudoalteromonas sp.]
MNLSVFFRNKLSIVTFLLLSVMVFTYLGVMLNIEAQPTPRAFITSSYECRTVSITNENQLVVYAPSKNIANDVVNTLCKNDVVAKQFGKVAAYWGYKTTDTVDFLGKGIADLILAKENLISVFMAESTYNYQAVVGYPTYTAFFISAKEKPKLTKSYFLDKRIGLLDYPTSRSGYILPKQLFKDLDINVGNLAVTYASSHKELRELLSAGRVDIIASYWQESDQQQFSKNYITAISDNISGSRWYLKMQDENTDLLCAVQGELKALAKKQKSLYFNEVEAYWQCGSMKVTSSASPLVTEPLNKTAKSSNNE